MNYINNQIAHGVGKWRSPKSQNRVGKLKEMVMEKKIENLPAFEVKVLEDSELRMVAGGSTAGTVSQCNKDGTNDASQESSQQ